MKRCIQCKQNKPGMEEITDVDPIDNGEFGYIVVGYICSECYEEAQCNEYEPVELDWEDDYRYQR